VNQFDFKTLGRLMIENDQPQFILVTSKSTVLKGLCQSDLFVKKKKKKNIFVSTGP